jgi:hypothetical protein
MFVAAPLAPKAVRNESEVIGTIQRAAEALMRDQAGREEKVLNLFDAKAICAATPLMSSGWSREVDDEIIAIVAHLLARHDKLSLLEIGAGTTWGSSDPHFGVPGLARALKQALPDALKIVATDREWGFDIFLVLPDGLLIHHQYRDDRPPKGLGSSLWKNCASLAPLSAVELTRSVRVDTEFERFLEAQKSSFNVDMLDTRCRIYIRPRVDPEVEALLYGVQSFGKVDYTELVESLIKVDRRERFDLVYGRHLCPVLSTELVRYLQEHLPAQLEQVAGSSFVHFDASITTDEGIKDLVFRHHTYF